MSRESIQLMSAVYCEGIISARTLSAPSASPAIARGRAESWQLVGPLSARIEREGRAVEHEFVLAADQVCINDRQPGFGGAVARHRQARGMLAGVIGRGVQHQQHLGA